MRIEALLKEAHARLELSDNPTVARAALGSLVELTALTQRSELKREVLSELERQKLILAQLQQSAEVDQQRLKDATARLGQEHARVNDMQNRPGHGLSNNEFLGAVRSRSGIPGGSCMFDLPALHSWLSRPNAERQANLSEWLRELNPIRSAIELILVHLRNSGSPEQVSADAGRYVCIPNLDAPPSLIRVAVAGREDLFPQVSAGRHRITIHFLRLEGPTTHIHRLNNDVPFTLTLCRL